MGCLMCVYGLCVVGGGVLMCERGHVYMFAQVHCVFVFVCICVGGSHGGTSVSPHMYV